MQSPKLSESAASAARAAGRREVLRALPSSVRVCFCCFWALCTMPPVYFVVTGFSGWQDCESNPTQQLVELLNEQGLHGEPRTEL